MPTPVWPSLNSYTHGCLDAAHRMRGQEPCTIPSAPPSRVSPRACAPRGGGCRCTAACQPAAAPCGCCASGAGANAATRSACTGWAASPTSGSVHGGTAGPPITVSHLPWRLARWAAHPALPSAGAASTGAGWNAGAGASSASAGGSRPARPPMAAGTAAAI